MSVLYLTASALLKTNLPIGHKPNNGFCSRIVVFPMAACVADGEMLRYAGRLQDVNCNFQAFLEKGKGGVRPGASAKYRKPCFWFDRSRGPAVDYSMLSRGSGRPAGPGSSVGRASH